jgi:hypothetical protein
MTIRDIKILEFLNEFKTARTSTLTDLFFDGKKRVARRRLKILTEKKQINRAKEGEYVYFSKLPTQYLHALLLTDYIAYLSKKFTLDLNNTKAEFKCGKIRSDALVILNGKPCFVEVQLTDAADINKYLSLKVSKEWENYFTSFPQIRILGIAPSSRLGSLDVVVDNPKAVCSLDVH